MPLLSALFGALSNPTVQSGIAGGLGQLFKKKPKVPEYKAPNIPGLGDLPHYLNLKEFAEKRINAGNTGEETPGVGYGPGFVDKATNPVADSMRRNFRNVTSPAISNEYSKRGIARSNLAADAQGKAGGDVESNIGNLMAQFYTLNEAQKKRDITEGIGVAEGQRGVSQGLSLARAGVEQGENAFDMGRYPIEAQQSSADNLLSLESIQQMLGIKSPQDKLTEAFTTLVQGGNSPRSNILGSMSDDDINRMIMERQFAQRMGQR